MLNNFVTELLNLSGADISSMTRFEFANPRNGWVYFSTTSTGGSVEMTLHRDDAVTLIMDMSDTSDKPTTQEAMRWLLAGEHVVTVREEETASLKNLIVRSIPELAYWRFPTRRGYNDTIVQDVMRYVNCVGITRAVVEDPQYQRYVEKWKQAGKRLIMGGALVPAYSLGPDMTVDQAYRFWADYKGFAEPKVDGFIVDEFGVGYFPVEQYPKIAQAIRRLTAERPTKLFYPFCMDMYGVQEVMPFIEAVIDNGAPIVWEWYEREEPDEKKARHKIDSTVTQGMKGWRNTFSKRKTTSSCA